jgi:HEAT repeat protein
VLTAGDEALGGALRRRVASDDPVIRCAALDVLRETRTGNAACFANALTDADHRVRLSAVRGLVSAREAVLVARAAGDSSREVRVAVADGLGMLGEEAGDPGVLDGLERLAGDPDPLVREAAFKAAGAVGCPAPLGALAARALVAAAAGDRAWQARAGAAQALAAASPDIAVAPLAAACRDPHPDVRKAAIIAIGPMRTHAAVAEVLRAATADSDADVRGYARRALSQRQAQPSGIGG